MVLSIGYGRFAAAVNSLLVTILLCLSALFGLQGAHAQSTPVKLAILGDSLAAGYGVKPEQAIPARLEAALQTAGRRVAVITQRVACDTTAGWPLTGSTGCWATSPTSMIGTGANDALRGPILPLAQPQSSSPTSKGWRHGVARAWWRPRNFGPEYSQRVRRALRAAGPYRCAAPYPFFLDGVAQDAPRSTAPMACIPIEARSDHRRTPALRGDRNLDAYARVVALPVPEEIADDLVTLQSAGVPDARWAPENFLMLRAPLRGRVSAP